MKLLPNLNRVFIILLFTLPSLAFAAEPVFKNTQGQSFRFSDYHGKWVIINYWASWCRPCYKEIPELNAFYQKNKDNKAIIVGVDFDHDQGRALRNKIQRMNIKFPVITTDPAKLFGIGHVPGLPASYVINPRGKLVKRLLGPQTRQGLEAVIK